MNRKGRRQAALVRLVGQGTVSSQNEMVRLLKDLGFQVTQSSVSRDVRELGLVRVNRRYVPATSLTGAERADRADAPWNELVISVEPVGANLIVVHTMIGTANTVAVEIDRQQLSDIAGTVAGDDTIFVAVRSRSAQGRVVAMLKSRLRSD